MVNLGLIQKMIINELQTELIGQGHKATGNLFNSIKGRTLLLPDSLVIEIAMNRYGGAVNEGRNPKEKRIPVDVLMEWIERKAIASGDKEKKSIAFAIQEKIYQEGSPTNNSFKYSNNGRRKGFVDFVINNKLDKTFDILANEVFKDMDRVVIDIVANFNKNNK